jgi:hypothetical protein
MTQESRMIVRDPERPRRVGQAIEQVGRPSWPALTSRTAADPAPATAIVAHPTDGRASAFCAGGPASAGDTTGAMSYAGKESPDPFGKLNIHSPNGPAFRRPNV